MGASPLRASSCPPGRLVVAAGAGATPIEITRHPGGGFRAAGGFGASVVGLSRAWEDVPADVRADFDATLRCLAERGDLLAAAWPEAPPRTRHDATAGAQGLPTRPRYPVPLLMAVLLATFLVGTRRGGLVAALRFIGFATVLAAIAAVHAGLLRAAYFHQNGQGPAWVGIALGEPSVYGPGYAEVYGAIARVSPDPDAAVFTLSRFFAATTALHVALLLLGRSVRATVVTALAFGVAVQPMLIRVGASESYFAPIAALLSGASALLSCLHRPDEQPTRRVLAGFAAGLLVAQAARIHPIAWLPAVLVPSPLLFGEGPLRRRMVAAVEAAGLVALAVVTSSGSAMLEVARGPLGERWLTDHGTAGEFSTLGIALALASAFVALRARRASATPSPRDVPALAVALLASTYVVWKRGDVLSVSPAWIHHAYAWTYVAPACLGVGVLAEQGLAHEERRIRATIVVLLVALPFVVAGCGWQAAVARPTDALEALHIRRLRRRFPADATIAYFERAGRSIVRLPLHGLRTIAIRAGEPVPPLAAIGDDVYLVHTSLCSSVEGRGLCAVVEAGVQLELIDHLTLPARPSMDDAAFAYVGESVPVRVYRVSAARGTNSSVP